MEKYVYRPYSREFVKFFEMEKMKIHSILGKGVIIEHVGSTAVKGLGGKGIVDVMIGVLEKDMYTASTMLEKEYVFRPEAGSERMLFYRMDYPSKDGMRRVHIHLVVHGSREWKEMLSFRDYLRKHDIERKRYAKLKREAARMAEGEEKIYKKHKQAFFDRVLARAVEEQRKINQKVEKS